MRKVAIIDDSEDVRLLWRSELRHDSGFEVCAEGCDGRAAIEIAIAHQPDVMLLDLAMPGMGGLEALPLVLEVSPQTQVVVLTGFGRREFSRTAGALGACGFVEKHLRAGSLAHRLREALGEPGPGPSADEPTVLVVDPSPENRELAGHLLTWLGYRFEVTQDAARALDLVRSRIYAAALMADQLTDMTGLEATLELRRGEPLGRRTPVIVLAEHDSPEARAAGLAAGADDHLITPLHLSDLGAVLLRLAPLPDPDGVARAAQPAGDLDHDALAGLLDRIGPEALSRVLQCFREQTTDRLTHLQTAISTGDAREVSRLAHAIAGAAAGVGALNMERLGGELEFLSGTGSLDGSRDRAERLRLAFESASATLARDGLIPWGP